MRATETRLAKIEQERAAQKEAQAQREIAEWRSAGGPMSLVYGETDEDRQRRIALLREAGAISPLDRVFPMLAPTASGKTFMRALMFRDFTPQELDQIRAVLRSPPRPAS